MRNFILLSVSLALAACGSQSSDEDASGSAYDPSGPISQPAWGGALEEVTPTYVMPDEKAVEIVSDYIMRDKGDAIDFNIDHPNAANVAFPILSEAAARCMHLYNFRSPEKPHDEATFPRWLAAELKLAGGRYVHNGIVMAVETAQNINGYTTSERSIPGKIRDYREVAELGRVDDALNAAHGFVGGDLKHLPNDCSYIAEQFEDVFMSSPPALPLRPNQVHPMRPVLPIFEEEYLKDFVAEELIGHRYTSG